MCDVASASLHRAASFSSIVSLFASNLFLSWGFPYILPNESWLLRTTLRRQCRGRGCSAQYDYGRHASPQLTEVLVNRLDAAQAKVIFVAVLHELGEARGTTTRPQTRYFADKGVGNGTHDVVLRGW
ncbi:hypothetical protein C8T65DRAFT_300138 [Cerioporus squamosus]|nr:hypothetical protein C8T65DRAFT_300138 [Cerioporus squamosus]